MNCICLERLKQSPRFTSLRMVYISEFRTLIRGISEKTHGCLTGLIRSWHIRRASGGAGIGAVGRQQT